MVKFLHIILIQTFILLLALSCTAAGAKDLSFTISPDKSEYSKRDPINISFKLKNKGKKAVHVNRRFYINSEEAEEGEREVYFTVTSPGGEKLPCKHKSDTGFPRTDNFILLGPGQEIKGERPKNIKHLFDFKQQGVYKVLATYKNSYGKEIGLDTFREKIDSEPIKIRIVE